MNYDHTVFSQEQVIEGSTPLKNDNHVLPTNLFLSPIVRKFSLNNTLEDIDSAYFSRLKGNSPSINSVRSPLITSIRSPSKFTCSCSKIFDSSNSSQHVDNDDILSKLFDRNIFHILRIILNFLEPTDYLKLFLVCKNWKQIANDDLVHNFKRRIQLKQLKKNFILKKENVVKPQDFFLNESIEQPEINMDKIHDEKEEMISYNKIEKKPLSPELMSSSNTKKTQTICSRKNRKNLKRL
ncbi:unnamed protein product [Brachionus calyciflorus]|uniref:F-box domain-containing protein n=1 Tax=Brachionus calyciflorus TaxID=104777 RepID=A0A813M0I0_9BILA|nr:unnamed protein product [Brachionus calyciflorus]